MNKPQLSAEMEKRFDEEFVQVCTNNDEGGHYDYPSLNTSSPIEIKNFLATALEEQRDIFRSWVTEGELESFTSDGLADFLYKKLNGKEE